MLKFNVGGQVFVTSRDTICKSPPGSTSILKPSTEIGTKYIEGAAFIDRNPEYFPLILDYLRAVNAGTQFIVPNLTSPEQLDFKKRLLVECGFYRIEPLKKLIIEYSMFDSVILQESNRIPNFFKLLRDNKKDELVKPDKVWKLLYRGSQHGFGRDDFLKRCEGHRETITFIKTNRGFIFGGFTNAPWKSGRSSESDLKAFLFSLANAFGMATVMNIKPGTNYEVLPPIFSAFQSPQTPISKPAICVDYHSGLEFGDGDFRLGNPANSSESKSSLGNSYEVPQSAAKAPNSYLAGSPSFIVTEIEVFKSV